MTTQEKMEILEKFLNKYGLSLNDRMVSDFLYEYRQLEPLSEEEKKTLIYSDIVKPTMLSLLPSDIENASYAGWLDLPMLIDWYLYKNAGDNPLVFENLEKDHQRLKESFEERKQVQGFMTVSPNGKIFNGNDGNHRLLTLIIKHFAERASAKTEDEKKAVDDRYRMNLNASYPISMELYNLLEKEKDSIRPRCNRKTSYYQACQYREYVFAMANQGDYLAEYDHNTGKYKYSLNGRAFNGTEQELINYLKTKEISTKPIMTYKCNDTYYISCHNRVWETKDREKAIKLVHKIDAEYKLGNIQEDKFLAVKNCDNTNDKAYTIKFPGTYIEQENKEENKRKASEILDILNSSDSKVLGEYALTDLKQQCEKTLHWGDLNVHDIELYNLSREDYFKASSLLTEISNILYPKNLEQTL